MNRILFVDDEPNVLNGLGRLLRGMRHQWEMDFAESSAAALALLERKRIDVIVTDIRMPVMDGTELLLKVKQTYPHMVRIILTGNSSPQTVFRSVRVAHQYLAKPCEEAKLLSVLQRASLLSDLLRQEDLAELISQLEALPAMTDEYRQLMEELDAEEPSLRKISEIVGRDMGMTASLFKVVNSAFFGLGRHISNPLEAVTLLGLDVVKGLVVSAKIFDVFERNKIPGFSFDFLWQHSLNTAGLGKSIAQAEGLGKAEVDEVFIGGMLHDLGKLVLASLIPALYNPVLDLVRSKNLLIWQAEKQILGTTHAEVGAYLMGLWGFSDGIVNALAYHHRPADLPGQGFGPLVAVHVANFAEHEFCVVHRHYARRSLDRDHLAGLGLEPKLPRWLRLGQGLLECGALDE